MKSVKVFVLLAIVAGLGVFESAAAWASDSHGEKSGRSGYVIPCSLDGVNPAVHPDIFGSPAAAKSYGFYLGSDHVWHVQANCHIR